MCVHVCIPPVSYSNEQFTKLGNCISGGVIINPVVNDIHECYRHVW